MTRFVAFLRAINVGGRITKKKKLQEAFLSMGFPNPRVHKQSGNVIFDADYFSAEQIEKKVEENSEPLIGFCVKAIVRTSIQLKELLKTNPFIGLELENSSFLVTFLSETPKVSLKAPQIIPNTTAKIISIKGKEVFSVTHGGGEGGKPNPFLESKLKMKTTTRNWNTIKEIVEEYL